MGSAGERVARTTAFVVRVSSLAGATPCHRVALVDEEPQTANPAVCATRCALTIDRVRIPADPRTRL
jgi:hypothetical protein